MASQSVVERENGNRFHELAEKEECADKCLTLYKNALGKYQNAYKCAKDEDELASAAKNIATIYNKLSKYEAPKTTKRVIQYKEGLLYFTKALHHGRSSKTKKKNWLQAINKNITECIRGGFQYTESMDLRQAVDTIESFVQVLSESEHKYQCYNKIIELLLKPSVQDLDSGKYGQALGYLRECKTVLNDVEMLQVSSVVKDQIQELKEKISLLLCRAESMQLLDKANSNLDDVIKTRQHRTNTGLVYEIIDIYRKVINMTEGKGIQTTSQAYRKLSQIFKDLIPNKHKAAEYQQMAEIFGIEPHKEEDNPPEPKKACTNQSLEMRTKGNKYYEEATNLDVDKTKRMRLLHDSCSCYEEALKLAENKEDKASAAKNYASACSQLAEHYVEHPKYITEAKQFYAKALDHFSQALKYGKETQKKSKWLRSLSDSYKKCLDSALRVTDAEFMTVRQAVDTVEAFVCVIAEHKHKFTCYKKIIDKLYKQSKLELDGWSYANALGYMKECGDILKCIEELELRQEDHGLVQSIKHNVNLQLCRAKSMQVLDKADVNRTELKSIKPIKNDIIYEVVDLYRQVINMTKDKGKGLESITLKAYRGLECIYQNILTDNTRAFQYKQLADLLDPVSESERLRKEGNEIFKKVQTGACDENQEQDLLHSALRKYKEAKTKAQHMEDALSATKNIALTLHKLAQKTKSAKYYENALFYFSDALKQGKNANKSKKWMGDLLAPYLQCKEEAKKKSLELNDDNATGLIQCLLKQIHQPKEKWDYLVKIAINIYDEGVQDHGCSDITKPQEIYSRARYYLQNANSLSETEQQKQHIDELEKRIDLRLSELKLTIVDQMYNDQLQDQHKVNTDNIRCIVDSYREVIRTTEKTPNLVNITAKAHYRLGLVFVNIHKNYDKAREEFMRACHLSNDFTFPDDLFPNTTKPVSGIAIKQKRHKEDLTERPSSETKVQAQKELADRLSRHGTDHQHLIEVEHTRPKKKRRKMRIAFLNCFSSKSTDIEDAKYDRQTKDKKKK